MSVERVLEYAADQETVNGVPPKTDPEPPRSIAATKPAASWPANGEIVIEGLSVKVDIRV